jgi:hypothetical protein
MCFARIDASNELGALDAAHITLVSDATGTALKVFDFFRTTDCRGRVLVVTARGIARRRGTSVDHGSASGSQPGKAASRARSRAQRFSAHATRSRSWTRSHRR